VQWSENFSINVSALKHDISVDQIRHAIRYRSTPTTSHERRGLTIIAFVGFDPAGNEIEIAAIMRDTSLEIIHAMRKRKSFVRIDRRTRPKRRNNDHPK